MTIVAHGFVFSGEDHWRIWRDREGLYRLQRNDGTAQYFTDVAPTYYFRSAARAVQVYSEKVGKPE